MSMNYNRTYELGPHGAWYVVFMMTQKDIHVQICICIDI